MIQKNRFFVAWRSTTWETFVFSLLIIVLGYFLFPSGIWSLYQKRSVEFEKSTFWSIYFCYFISNFYKYIPGKVSTLLIALREAGKLRFNKFLFIQAWMGAFVLSIFIGICLFLFFLGFFLNMNKYNSFSFFLVFFAAFLFLIPSINYRVNVFVLQIFKKETSHVLRFEGYGLIRAFFIQITAWLLFGLSFAFISKSFLSLNVKDFFFLTLSYPLAHTIGFLVLVAPAGIGVREGLLVGISLNYFQPENVKEFTSILVLISVFHRAIMLVADILLFIAAHAIKRYAMGVGSPNSKA
jgi:hypothetical protein